jgi:hypothetical protein
MNLTYKAGGLTVLFILGSLFALSGCGQGKEAVKFNDSIVNALQRLGPAGEKFGLAVQPALTGGKAELEEVRRAHKSAKDTVASIKEDGKTWKVPDRPSAKALYAAYENLMATQEECINKDFAEIVTILEDEKAPVQVKAQKIDQVTKRLEPREKAAMSELDAKQKAFAKDFNIKLVYK